MDHKRTFYFLEQLILKHNAHEKASSIKSFPDGINFYFADRSHALRFVDFLQESVPTKMKKAKKLISADNHSNTHNYKFTYAVDIAPVCKDDIVVLPTKLAHNLGNISKLCLVSHVSSSIHLVDPFTLQKAEVDIEKYWRYPFEAVRSCKAMCEFTVLDATPTQAAPLRNGRKAVLSQKQHACPPRNRRERLADMEVVRESDFGVNDTTFHIRSHLGMLLKSGDTAMGYDLSTAVFNDAHLTPLNDDERSNMPDVVLVRKVYPKTQRQATQRQWHLKSMEGVQDEASNNKRDLNRAEEEYERFLQDLEQDKSLRSQINIYKSKAFDTSDSSSNNNNNMSSIPIEELLEDLTTADDDRDEPATAGMATDDEEETEEEEEDDNYNGLEEL